MERSAGGVEPWEIGDEPEIAPDADVIATTPERSDRGAILRERWGRWAFTAVLVVFLALGLAGVFGMRTRTTTTSGGGYDLRVTYAAASRAGLATMLEIQVAGADGAPLEAPVELAVSSHYLAMFDENGVVPAPSSETATPERVVWEFDPPTDGSPLTVDLDARLEPGVQWGRDGWVQVLDDGEPVAEATFHTWVVP